MIRTKDLLLFVLAFLFLLLAIVATIDPKRAGNNDDDLFKPSGDFTDTDYGGVYEEVDLDRNSITSRLRSLIAQNQESVLTAEVDQATEEDLEENNNDVVEVLKCESESNPLALARTWPKDGVELREAEGLRLVSVSLNLPVANDKASSTDSSVLPPSYLNLLKLPVNPTKVTKNCLSSEIVGVTIDGALLFNSDAIAYRSRQSNELLGYARDGFPIYGNYDGEVDECGGYEVQGEYRYSLSTDRNFVLGCYMGAPNRFLNEI